MATAAPRYLVTGGAGFIGSHIVHRLREQGASVRVVDNLSTGSLGNLDGLLDQIELIEGDLADPAVAERAVDGVEIVFHLAALGSVPRSLSNSWGSHDANVNGTLRLLEAARGAKVRRFVYSSSSSVYGDTPTLPKVEEMEPLPRSPYAAGKLSGEQYVLAYARAGLVEGVALRYFNVFGPRQSPEGAYAAVIPLFMRAARDGVPARIFGDGGQTRDFTYVDNVVAANLLAADAPAAQANGWVTNVGAGARTSLRELVALIEQASGRPIVVESAPPRNGDVRDSLAGLDRAERVLGYRPLVPLRDGLERTWAWFVRSGAPSSVRPSAPAAETR
jgi:UDP-glucose 4-epimerase